MRSAQGRLWIVDIWRGDRKSPCPRTPTPAGVFGKGYTRVCPSVYPGSGVYPGPQYVSRPYSAEPSHSLKVSDRRRNTPKSAQNRSESLCRFVGTVPDILRLVWPSFRPKPGSRSKIPGRILKSCRGPLSSSKLREDIKINPDCPVDVRSCEATAGPGSPGNGSGLET